MNLTVDFWWLVGFFITIIGAFFTILKMMMSGFMTRIHERLDNIQNDSKKNSDDVRNLERDHLNFKTEVVRDFVLREDHNKDMAALKVSIDNLSLKIDNYFLQSNKG